MRSSRFVILLEVGALLAIFGCELEAGDDEDGGDSGAADRSPQSDAGVGQDRGPSPVDSGVTPSPDGSTPDAPPALPDAAAERPMATDLATAPDGSIDRGAVPA